MRSTSATPSSRSFARSSAPQGTRPAPIRWTPGASDKIALEFLLTNGSAGLLLDPGLHKTSITLKAFSVLRAEGVATTMLVVAPLRPAYRVWPKERDKWLDFNGLRMEVLHGPKKGRALERPADVYVVNVEGLPWLLEHPLFRRKFKGAVLAVDESTKFKNHASKRFRMLRAHLPLFKRRWILTGSPRPKNLTDLWPQCYILDMGHALGQYVSHFRNRWFEPCGYGGYSWKPRSERAVEEIHAAVAPLVVRLAEKDYLKLPRLVTDIDDPIVVDLPREARRVYDQMETLLFAKIGRKEVNAANAAVAVMKCEQIANGGLYDDEEPGAPRGGRRRWTRMHDEKSDAVRDVVEELSGGGALVTYQFRHDLERLLELFPGAPLLDGSDMDRLGEVEDAWNRDEVDALPVNPASASLGLNLQRGGMMVLFHSITWNYEDYDQLIRRLYRDGRKRPVIVKHVVARNTVDEAKLAVLRARAQGQKEFFEYVKEYGRKRGLYK